MTALSCSFVAFEAFHLPLDYKVLRYMSPGRGQILVVGVKICRMRLRSTPRQAFCHETPTRSPHTLA